ncbi:MAG: phospholipase D-like domain-containing protein [Formosimonas sp.]
MMRKIMALLLPLVLGACNNLVEPRRTHLDEFALPVVPSAPLPQMVAQVTPAQPVEPMKKTRQSLPEMLHKSSPLREDSGIYPLIDGVEAFAVRNALIKNAQTSLDLQYYSLQRGLSSRLLIRELVHAADRGVRVRILVDDMDMLGRDHEMTVLSAHPNIEVRIFNPIRRGRGTMLTRVAMFAINLPTQHRRMHNKVWLADNVLAIAGGRNIGDRYFNAGDEDNFSDLDVLMSGKVVAEVSRSFDAYWNSKQTFPVDVFEKKPEGSLEDIQKMIYKTNALTRKERVARHPYLAALGEAEHQVLPKILPQLMWGEVQFVVDSPDKVTRPVPHYGVHLTESDSPPFNTLLSHIQNAQKEVLIVSPYFVPGDGLSELLAQLVKKGVRVVVLSNSLESNDVPLVGGAYARYRKKILQSGVEIYELRGFPDVDKAPQWRLPIFSWHGSRTALHTKAVVVDGQMSFVGSMNLDPRSVVWNTETGVLTQQKPFADKIRSVFANAIEPRYSYRVTLDETGRMQWSPAVDGEPMIRREPGNFWRRFLQRVSVPMFETFM